jgi:peptidoglycan/xylan/chitin deacetylase (PgdA/CDA1 family)
MDSEKGDKADWMITFDDGGRGAYRHARGILDSHGFFGHFFVTTDLIDTPGFLTQDEIQELRDHGHIIGSHSCSHPEIMSSLSPEEILGEWKDSLERLSDILDEQVDSASLPGGYYSRKAAVAAAKAGVKYLFTSEPTSRQTQINGCLVIGRYIVKMDTPPDVVCDLACGSITTRWRQWILWNTKKIAKLVMGSYYLKLRRSIINRAGGSS